MLYDNNAICLEYLSKTELLRLRSVARRMNDRESAMVFNNVAVDKSLGRIEYLLRLHDNQFNADLSRHWHNDLSLDKLNTGRQDNP